MRPAAAVPGLHRVAVVGSNGLMLFILFLNYKIMIGYATCNEIHNY